MYEGRVVRADPADGEGVFMAASLYRQGRPRRTAARLLGGALVCAVLAAGDDVATAQAGIAPTICALHPVPGALLAADSPSAYIAARVTASVPIRRIELRLDGKPIGAAVLGPDERRESLFAQPPHWTPGRHHVAVIAWDVRGRQGRRAWWFWITSRPTSALPASRQSRI
jgi:hypothetical protein